MHFTIPPFTSTFSLLLLLILPRSTTATPSPAAPLATISCSAPLTTGLLSWGNFTTSTAPIPSGQLGIISARGNAEFLTKYPAPSVYPYNITITPCNSSFVNASNPASPHLSSPTLYVKLSLTPLSPAGPSSPTPSCLGLIATGGSGVTVIKQACSGSDGPDQGAQFWERRVPVKGGRKGELTPLGQNRQRYLLQFNAEGGGGGQVIASPDPCTSTTPGNGCQSGPRIAVLAK